MQEECYCAHGPDWSSFSIEENDRDEDSDRDWGDYQMGKDLIGHQYGFGFKVGEIIDS